MKNHEIARAIANIAIFLEFSPDDILDEDASMQAMEQLSSDLQELDRNSREILSSGFRSIASDYKGMARNFVENLPDSLGIE